MTSKDPIGQDPIGKDPIGKDPIQRLQEREAERAAKIEADTKRRITIEAAANSPRRRALLEERARFVAESLRRWYGHQASEPEAWALFARYFTSPFAMTLEERDRAEALGTQLLLARSSSRGGA